MCIRDSSNNGKNGQISEFHNNGVIASEKKFKNQLPHGIWKYYTKRNRIYKSTPYENGKINGIELTLNGNDTVSSKKYVFGVKSGQWKSFYNNGKPKEYATYKFNELEGPFIHFFENGNKQYEGNYYRGRRTNDWIYYDSKGRPIFKETYRKGLIVSKQDINKP